MATLPKAPSGVTMMLKAFGVDPQTFEQTIAAVRAVAEALGRIEKKQDRIIKLLEGGQNGRGIGDAGDSGSIGQ
jgi:hypothetical protein